MKSTLPLLPLLVLGAGCRNAASGYVPTPPPKVEPISTKIPNGEALMPLVPGNQWTYDLKTEAFVNGKSLGSNTESVSYQVISRNGDKALMALQSGGLVMDRQDWQTNNLGLYQLSGGLNHVIYKPAQPAAPFPLEAGRKFKWAGTGMMPDGTVGAGKIDGEILAPESVDTGIGTLSAIPVISRSTFGKSYGENTAWFKPGIGLVRLRQETLTKDRRTVLTLSLTNHVLKRS